MVDLNAGIVRCAIVYVHEQNLLLNLQKNFLSWFISIHLCTVGITQRCNHLATFCRKRDRCCILRKALRDLGYLVDKDGLYTDSTKVECMLNYPIPKIVECAQICGNDFIV